MESSFHELNTLVADNVYMNIYLKNSFAYAEIGDNSEVTLRQSGFDHSLKYLTCLTTQKTCDTICL